MLLTQGIFKGGMYKKKNFASYGAKVSEGQRMGGRGRGQEKAPAAQLAHFSTPSQQEQTVIADHSNTNVRIAGYSNEL